MCPGRCWVEEGVGVCVCVCVGCMLGIIKSGFGFITRAVTMCLGGKVYGGCVFVGMLGLCVYVGQLGVRRADIWGSVGAVYL